jgi:integrase
VQVRRVAPGQAGIGGQRVMDVMQCVPLRPRQLELVVLLGTHIERYGTGKDGRLFIGPRGGVVAEWSYLDVFHQASRVTLTDAEAHRPLMGRPYDLRHAAVSTWLNAGVPRTQVAEWAGHSVLLRAYAKCIVGQQHEAKRRIEDATRDEPREVAADDAEYELG